jgi:hypothetical protein
MLTVEQVKKAYEDTGITPRDGGMLFLDFRTEKVCGCAVGASYCAAKGFKANDINFDNRDVFSSKAWDNSAALFFKDENEMMAFIHGFDRVGWYNDTETEGYKAGEACRKAILG